MPLSFVAMAELLHDALRRGYAVPSFCIWNAETADAVLRVAEKCRAPVILMTGPGELLLSYGALADTARALAARYDVPAALLLDHGNSIEAVEACLAAGFTSVMLDYSTKPFDENVAALQQVVALARPRGVTVEGEIGAVGRVDEVTGEGKGHTALTDPDEARAYAAATGVDCLAVSFGNLHGNYKLPPKFDFELLAKLRDAAGVPLVLHGGSGTPPDDLRRAIALGIAKVNVASELNRALREALVKRWAAGEKLWVPSALHEAMAAFAATTEKWIHLTAAAGKARL